MSWARQGQKRRATTLLPPYQVKNPPNRSLGEHKTHIEIICKSATPYGLRLFSFYQRYTLDVCFDRKVILIREIGILRKGLAVFYPGGNLCVGKLYVYAE